MKNGLIIADSGPIFSLALIGQLKILEKLFNEVSISEAVWIEITRDQTKPFHSTIISYFHNKVKKIKGFNNLTSMMDLGESESVILYKEQKASFLLIDDKKARAIAENLGINCIGTLGLLTSAKEHGQIENLKPLFETFINNQRFYSINLLNAILKENGETEIVL